MMLDFVLLVEKFLFVGVQGEVVFFEVGDFVKCLILGQFDNLWKGKNMGEYFSYLVVECEYF